MGDTQEGRKSWLEWLSSSPEEDPEDSDRTDDESMAEQKTYPDHGREPEQSQDPGQRAPADHPGAVDLRGSEIRPRPVPETGTPPVRQFPVRPRAGEAATIPADGEQADPGTGSRRDEDDASATAREPTERSRPPEEERRKAIRKWDVETLQHRWLITQAQLIDYPWGSVREAGLLIDDAMQLATKMFSEHRARLEGQWKDEAGHKTDELRSIMQSYRTRFEYVLGAGRLLDDLETMLRGWQEEGAAAKASELDPSAIVEPGIRAHRGEPTTEVEVRPPWYRTRPARWIAVVGLVILLGLAAAFGLWRWRGVPGPRETTPQASPQQTERVEPARRTLPTARRAATGPGPLVLLWPPDQAGLESQFDLVEVLLEPPPPQAPRPPEERVATAREQAPAVEAPRDPSPAPPAVTEPEPATPEPEEAILTEEAIPGVDLDAEATATASPSEGPPMPIEEVRTLGESGMLEPAAAVEPPREPSTAPTESEPTLPRMPETLEAPTPEPPMSPAVSPGDLVQLTDPGVVRPVMTVAPQVRYPVAAQRMRREATVELRVLVDERGQPAQVERMGDRVGFGLDEAATQAVQDARWRPATQDGVPVKVWIQTAVRFQFTGQ